MIHEGRIAMGEHRTPLNQPELLGDIASDAAARTCGYNEGNNMRT
jgi:hypothetical protein